MREKVHNKNNSVKGFQSILAWQQAHKLTILIYKDFKDCQDWGFRDQIQRAAVSVMNNVAEGHAKRSNKSFINFLLIAKGSLAEVQSMLILSYDLGYLSEKTVNSHFELAEETAKIISGLIKGLTTQSSELTTQD